MQKIWVLARASSTSAYQAWRETNSSPTQCDQIGSWLQIFFQKVVQVLVNSFGLFEKWICLNKNCYTYVATT